MSRPRFAPLYLLPRKSSIAQLHQQLKGMVGVGAVDSYNVQFLFLDSFDWRLYRKGWALQASQHNEKWLLKLYEIKTGTTLAISPIDFLPRFITDIPTGALVKKLSKPLFPRALSTVCELQLRRREYVYCNQEGKQYLRLFLDQPQATLPEEPRNKKLLNWLAIEPIRGYEKEAQKFIKSLFNQVELSETDFCMLCLCLDAWNIEPTIKNTKAQIQIRYDEPAHQALKRIFLSLLDTMCVNENGLIEQLDTEFLHDYRIAARRTRSLLGQFKKIIPPDKLDMFKNEYAWLSSLTGPARDYDVMLLELPEYQASLPGYDIADFTALESYLREQQQNAYKTLAEALRSNRYTDFKQNWRNFLESDDSGVWDVAAQIRIGEFANKRIQKVYKQVISEGKKITPQSPVEDFHELRKLCKKLRYLMEMFRELYPSYKVKILTKELKNLQNDLGKLQDLEVHAEILQDFLTRKTMNQDNSHVPVNAIQQSIDDMNTQKKAIMHNFCTPFNSFASKTNKNLFAELLGMKNA